VIGIAAAGCSAGCGKSDEEKIRTTLADLQSALVERDVEAACALTTSGAHRRVGEVGHSSPTTCPQDIRRFTRSLIVTPDDPRRLTPTVGAVTVKGDRAAATLLLNDRTFSDVPLVKNGDGWKVDALFGDLERDSRIGTGADADRAVEVRRGRGTNGANDRPVCPSLREHPPIEDSDGKPRPGYPPRYSGGCLMRASGELTLYSLNVAEDMRFGRCEISFTLRVSGTGDVTVEDYVVDGTTPCNDAETCVTTADVPFAWRGRITARVNGKPRLHLAICLDTCMGRFAGPATIDLSQNADSTWRADATNVHVGRSGWRFADGSWRLRSLQPIDIRPAA
jgi:hypothetical protein